MVSYGQIGLIIMVLLIMIIASNNTYFRAVNNIYKNLSKIPKLIIIVISICSLFGVSQSWIPSIGVIHPKIHTSPADPIPKTILSPSVSSDGTNKRNVSESMKKMVAANQQWHCGLCHRLLDETYEVDHIVPLYKGGSNQMDNLMALDPICHRKKTNADRLAA